MREEIKQKLIMLLHGEEIENEKIEKISNAVTILLNDYEIQARETAVAIRSEDKNRVFLQKFLIAKTIAGRTERTIDYYKKSISFALERINKPADEITADDIRYYLALRQKQDGISKTTAGNELRNFRTFFQYLTQEELIPKNPCLKIEAIKKETRKKKAFTELDVEKIRIACGTARESALIEILLSTGCRVSEVAQILISDLENEKLIVHGKGQKDRTVYLNAKAQMAVGMYLKERKDSNPYLFAKGKGVQKTKVTGKQAYWYLNPENIKEDGHTDKSSIESLVRRLGKRAGVEKCHPHRFRRTCATFALRRGMPIEQVSKMLGHNSVATTQIYLDLSEEELQQAHKKYVV